MNRTDWFYKAGFGMFCHWTTATLPKSGEKKDYHQAVEDFCLDTFVKQVVDSGAKFLFFTISHSEMHLPCPLPELDEIVPGHMNLDKIVDAVKMGVAMAGGTPVTIQTEEKDNFKLTHEKLLEKIISRWYI